MFARPIGSPASIGLSGLVAASLVLSGLELGWIAATDRHQVAIVLLAFAFPLQLIAALFALLGRDGAVATAMAVLAGTWLSTGLMWLSTPPHALSEALGLLTLAAGALLAAAALAAAAGKLLPAAVFILEALRFGLAGVHELSAAAAWQHAAGALGLVVAALAGYAVLALALEDALRRTVLPVGRRGRARAVQHEAGVREAL